MATSYLRIILANRYGPVSQQYVLVLHIVTNCEHTETIMMTSRMTMTMEELQNELLRKATEAKRSPYWILESSTA